MIDTNTHNKQVTTIAEGLSQSQLLSIISALTNVAKQKEAELTETTTVYKFIKDNLEYIHNNNTTKYYKSVMDTFKHFTQYFPEDTLLADIKLMDLEKFKIHLMKEVPSGYKTYIRTLKAAFSRALTWEMISTNPAKGLKIKKGQEQEAVAITREELDKVIPEITNKTISLIVLSSYNTGFRLQEVVNLRWSNIDLINNKIKIGDKHFTTKSKKQRTVNFSKELLTILSSLPRVSDEAFVFAKPNGFPFDAEYVSKSFKKACRKAGIREEVTFHSLRHGFATRHAERNTSPMVLQKLLGHAHIETTMRYIHIKDSMLKEAMESFS